MLHYHYTANELKNLLQTITILIDTREQVNGHIVNYFLQNRIAFKAKKLDFGDYSFSLPANPEMGLMRDTYFCDTFAVERKNSLEELSGTLTNGRDRFENELTRGSKARMLLLVENATLEDIICHNYRTEYQPKAFIAALKTYEIRYNLASIFVPAGLAGMLIYTSCYYCCREYLKGAA